MHSLRQPIASTMTAFSNYWSLRTSGSRFEQRNLIHPSHKIANRSLALSRNASSLETAHNVEPHYVYMRQIAREDAPQPTAGRTKRVVKRLLSSLPIGANQQRSGALSSSDRRNPLRRGRYADEYSLRGVNPGQWVTVHLKSKQFDTYLQLINAATGRLIAQNNQAELGNSNYSKLNFTAQAGVSYRLRVTSYASREQGKYSLATRTSKTVLPGSYNVDYGYGLVNSAAAVAGAAGTALFADVPDLGGSNWGLDLVKAPEAWAQGFTGQGVTVAVLDTGVDYNHIDLKENLWTNPGEIAGNGLDDDGNGYIDDIHGWNFTSGGSSDVSDFDSHGTHVSGTIAAVNNGFGVTGVAYGAKVMPVKVVSDIFQNFVQFDVTLANGIRYAVQNGAKVLNMSLGTDLGEPSLTRTREALLYAKQQGAIAVIAAGNERNDGAIRPSYPALYASSNLAIAVGAVDIGKQVADFSNPAGERPLNYVVAPGVNVRSTVPVDQYASNWSGTSMATAYVSGVIALMLSANPNLTVAQVNQLLLSTATTSGITVF
jgi:subtilisin family serine protease